jgi:hypothetical protein
MSISRPRTVAVLAGTLLFALGACSSTTSGTGTTSGGGASAGMGSLAPAPTAPPTATASPSPAPSVVIVTASGDTSFFVTPSGNIDCAVSANSVRCDIGDRTWSAPPRPQDCSLDYGNGVVVDATGARLSCAGDTLLHATTNVLAYGHGVRDGQVLCVSQPSGVRCEYTGTGHGFTLAKEGYTLF